MDYKTLEEQFKRGAPVIRKIREDRLALLRDAQNRAGEQSLIDDWEDLGGAEDTTKRENSGRFLFELLQNANDAIQDWLLLNPGEDGQTGSVQIILSNDSLIVANQGLPFGEENVKAICRLGKSTKSLTKSIGHKGVGFKSVLEITNRPEVYSGDYAFGFSLKECARTIQSVIADYSIEDITMPIHRFPFERSLADIDEEDRTRIVELFNLGYVTIIRLPLIVSSAVVEEQIRKDLNQLTLLFLKGMGQLQVAFPSGQKLVVKRDPLGKNGSINPASRKFTLTAIDGASGQSTWLVIAPPSPIPISDPSLLNGLGKAWKKVTHVFFSLAFPISSDQEIQVEEQPFPFYVYFPTKDNSGFRFVINADFYVGSSRTHIPKHDFNTWLSKQIVEYLATFGITEIKRQFPNNPDIVNILAPYNEPQGEFGKEFHELYLDRMRTVDFVPYSAHEYCTPDKLRFAPGDVEVAAFQQFFPEEQLAVDNTWHYPCVAIEEAENQRAKQRQPSFLFRLGAKRLELDDILRLLAHGPAVPVSACQNFMAFLARWWQSLPPDKRSSFIAKMSTAAVIPTLKGWRQPAKDSTLIFQANLRKDEPDVPSGFDFEIVTSEAYGKTGSRSEEYQLLNNLGVFDYDALSIALRAILPAFEDGNRFRQLSAESIKGAYEFLKQNRPSLPNSRKGNLLLPAFRPSEGQIVWRPAKDLYLGEFWLGNDNLEVIYGGFEDVYFLGAPEFLVEIPAQAKQGWLDFFEWLGVESKPRWVSVTSPEFGQALKTSSSFCNSRFSNYGRWEKYLENYWKLFVCTNPIHQYATFRFSEVHTIHHLEDIIATGNREVMHRLFAVLAASWGERYYPKITTQIQCSRSSCNQPKRSLPNYFVFVLQSSDWVPALTRNTEARELLHPSEVWTLGQAEPQAVQRMVPILPLSLQQTEFALFQSNLKFMDSTKASFEDYLALLQRLPDLYPLDLPDLESDARNTWRSDIRTVFNWLCQSMQSILIRGDSKQPARPAHLKILAFRNDETPCYIEVDDKRLVYPNDHYLEERWADTCYYLRVDDDWRRLRDWLGIPNLSDNIEAKSEPSPELGPETDQAQAKLKSVLPYYLALIEKRAPSRLSDLVSRLKRLRCHVVEELWVSQRLKETTIEPKRYQEEIYLQLDELPGPHSGTVRIGNLYIKRTALENYALWGRPIASYIEIDLLADSLIMLLEKDNAMRWQYLRVKGVTEADYSRMQGKLGELDDSTVDERVDKKLNEILKKTLETDREDKEKDKDKEKEKHSEPPPEKSGPSDGNGNINGSQEGKRQEERHEPKTEEPNLPALEDVTVTGFDYRGDGEIPVSEYKRHGHGDGKGAPINWDSMESYKRLIGKRGEEIVFKLYEPNRLRSLGYTEEDIHRLLKWISRDDETADHDLESVDEAGNPIVIEVKSSAGENPSFDMSVPEFRKAMACRESYYLYRVFNVRTAQPYVWRYPNLSKLLEEKKMIVDTKQLSLLLPRAVKPEHPGEDTIEHQ